MPVLPPRLSRLVPPRLRGAAVGWVDGVDDELRPRPSWTTWFGYAVSVAMWLGTLALYAMLGPVGEGSGGPSLTFVVTDLVVGVVMIALVRLRWRHPLAVALVYAVSGSVFVSGSVPAMWVFVHLCTRRRWREVALASTVLVAAGLLADALQRRFLTGPVLAPMTEGLPPYYWVLMTVSAMLFTAVLVAVGYYLGARRDLVASLQERAETAEREQELRVLQGQAEERNRIAREMHDVLAHRMSLVSMHAGALAYRSDLSPEQTREIALVIQENAHASLGELRAVLGSLRGPVEDEAAPEKPQPLLSEVDDLVADARAGGQRIDLVNRVEHLDRVPALVSRHAYRVVQEAITNARKHAPYAVVSVEVSGAPGQGLTVVSRNPVRPGRAAVPGSGVGLLGLAERAQITGGRISHGVSERGTFDLTVWMPW